MSFDLAATDEDFIHLAPRRVGLSVDVAQPAHVVWDDLITDDPMSSYSRIISPDRLDVPSPFSTGATRTVRVLGGLFVGRPLEPVTHALFSSLVPDIRRHFAALEVLDGCRRRSPRRRARP